MTTLATLIAVARGDRPADLVLSNARIVNTLNGKVEEGDVAVYREHIAGVGSYPQGKEIRDLAGRYLAPGFVDGHTHLESSMLHPAQYARAVVPRGTTTVITDFHEIANVGGIEAVRYMMACAHPLPLDIFVMLPSCVPATPLETAGATVGAREIRSALRWKGVLGLGEMMNFPGVINAQEEVLGKLSLARAKVVDGHAPGLRGRELNAYLAAGILSDHESTTLEEAEEKLRRGMYLMIREGSSEKNLDTLLPLVTDKTYQRCLFVVDDRSCGDLLRDGDMDAILRKAIGRGLDPVRAIQLATLNPAQYFHLGRVGAIAPGYIANMVTFSTLDRLEVEEVFYRGRLVARNGQPLFDIPPLQPGKLTRTMNVKTFTPEALRLPADRVAYPVIEIVPGQIVTRKRMEHIEGKDGALLADTRRDILKLVVVERHRATGNIGRGLVKGLGLKRGALASSVAHDSHNIIAAGVDDLSLFTAIKELERLQGGLVATEGEKVLASLPLPVAGLLSEEPLEETVKGFEAVEARARELGATHPSPFAILSFLALPVIPELRLTDLGMVDVLSFKLI